jgi:hypothetical protein
MCQDNNLSTRIVDANELNLRIEPFEIGVMKHIVSFWRQSFNTVEVFQCF